MRPNFFNKWYLSSGFYRRKIISQENKTIDKYLSEFKKDKNNIELANKFTNLKNLNQEYFYNISNDSICSEDNKFIDKYKIISSLYFQRNSFECLKKFEEFDFKELEKLIEKNTKQKLDNSNKNSKEKEDNNLKLELAKIYNLKGVALIDNGYFTKSKQYLKNSSNLLNDSMNNQFHPLIINNKYDEIYSNVYVISDFETIRNNLLETIAKSKMIQNSYLIFKGYTYLSLIYLHSGSYRTAKFFSKYAFSQLKSTEFNAMLTNSILLKCLFIYINSNKNTKKDKLLSKYESLMKIHLADKKTEEISSDKKTKKSFVELEFLACKAYQESNLSLNFNKLYKSSDNLNRAIKILEENKYRDHLLALLYLRKWAIEISLGREATAYFYLDEGQKIINGLYKSDSFKNIEFLRSMMINCLNLSPPKIDLAKEILRKTKNITEEMNCNSLQQKFFNLAVSLRIQSGVAEIFNLYEDFLTSTNKYFNKDSEIIYDLKEILKALNLGFVYKNKN